MVGERGFDQAEIGFERRNHFDRTNTHLQGKGPAGDVVRSFRLAFVTADSSIRVTLSFEQVLCVGPVGL